MKTLAAAAAVMLAAAAFLFHVTETDGTETKVTFPTELILHLADDTRATVYNAEASQCNADFLHTASNFTINPDSIASYHIVAMERTMMKQYGISYGDRILVKGAGEYDGVWNVHDTMNVRFRGQHRIDFLVPSDIKTGRWENVTIYKII